MKNMIKLMGFTALALTLASPIAWANDNGNGKDDKECTDCKKNKKTKKCKCGDKKECKCGDKDKAEGDKKAE